LAGPGPKDRGRFRRLGADARARVCGAVGHGCLLMRRLVLASSLVLATLTASCAFRDHPTSGQQTCSNDQPPQCPDGYTCVTGLCYESTHLAAFADAGDSNSNSVPCSPAAIVCGTGSGKRCGKVADHCNGTVECGACIVGETCGLGRICSVACGQAGQPCCTGSTCTAADAVCSNGTCVPCGGAQQVCCEGSACSALGTTCGQTAATDTGSACLLACATITGTCASGTDVDCTTLCGPGKIGTRTCTCASDSWKCPGCTFPTGADYGCYKLPSTVSACSTNAPPTLGETCSVPSCLACGSATGKGFTDLTGTARAGYCVCTNGRWNCAVTKEWPCPGLPGC